MPRSRDQFEVFIQSAGWRASRIQPPTARTGRNPIRKTPSEKRGQPHFVQPPRICESAIVNPAPAISPYVAQYSVFVSAPTWVANQSRMPATAAPASVESPRVTPIITASVPAWFTGLVPATPTTEERLIQMQPLLVETGRMELGVEGLDGAERVVGEDVVHHADAAVVRERQVDVRLRDEIDRERRAGRAAHGETDPWFTRRDGDEGRGEDRPWPALGIAVEAPRPLPGPQAGRGGFSQLRRGVEHARGHQVDEGPRIASQRRPVEVAVGDEAGMELAAAAVELHLVDRRMRGSG